VLPSGRPALTREERERLKKVVDRARRAKANLLAPEVWLADELEMGPRDQAELLRAARERGFTAAAVRRAARFLGVEGLRAGREWRLPGVVA
jgi:hypothetical protein